MTEKLNATNLFEQPSRSFHNSESWWTAYFTMLLLWSEAHRTPIDLPWYDVDHQGELSRGGTVSFSGVTYRNLIVDASLRGEPFGITDWPNEYLNIRPDIAYIKSNCPRQAVFIETKTIGANVRRNIGLYANFSDYLRRNGWDVDFYYLLSNGYEEDTDWALLSANNSKVIIWEDVFMAATETPFGTIFGESLEKYVQRDA